MTTRVILARHGETDWNKEGRYQGQIDTDLSERGIKQAELLGLTLKEVHIDHIYASPLKRAFETAGAVAKHKKKEIGRLEGITEIAHGTWEGMLANEISDKYGDLVKQWHTNPRDVQMPEGENLTDVQSRAMKALDEVVKKHPNETILIVSHDATLKAIICGVLEIDLKNFWQIKQDNTCINILDYNNGTWRVQLLNDTCHTGQLVTTIEQAAL
jgi:phosphoserine phosphatase